MLVTNFFIFPTQEADTEALTLHFLRLLPSKTWHLFFFINPKPLIYIGLEFI